MHISMNDFPIRLESTNTSNLSRTGFFIQNIFKAFFGNYFGQFKASFDEIDMFFVQIVKNTTFQCDIWTRSAWSTPWRSVMRTPIFLQQFWSRVLGYTFSNFAIFADSDHFPNHLQCHMRSTLLIAFDMKKSLEKNSAKLRCFERLRLVPHWAF